MKNKVSIISVFLSVILMVSCQNPTDNVIDESKSKSDSDIFSENINSFYPINTYLNVLEKVENLKTETGGGFSNYSKNSWEYIYEKQNNNSLGKTSGNDSKIKANASYQRFSDGDVHLIGEGSFSVNDIQIMKMKETFSNRTLTSELILGEYNNNKLTIIVTPVSEKLDKKTEFKLEITGEINGKVVNYSSSIKGNDEIDKFAEIKNILSGLKLKEYDDLSPIVYHDFVKLNNKWSGWDEKSSTKDFTALFNENKNKLNKTTLSWGSDDAWASALTGIVVGLVSGGAGIVYGLLDTFITTY